VFLPRLSSERLRRQWRTLPCAIPVDEVLVTVVKDRGVLRLAAVDANGEAVHLTPGMTLADARAMHPRLITIEADAAADRDFLEDLADLCLRYTPLVALDVPQGLLLDITGCAHLFGGEAALRTDLIDRLSRWGLTPRAAIASTIGAAWAFARFGHGDIAEGAEHEALGGLPLAALRLPAAMTAALERVGLKRIGDILERPRAPLTARFGPLLLQRLAQALGQEDEPLSPRLPVAPYMAERRLAEPIAREADVLGIAVCLARRLAEMLERHGEGARGIRLSLFRTDGVVKSIETNLGRPTRDPHVLGDLLGERLAGLADQFDPGFGFDCLTLAITETAALDAETIGFNHSRDDEGLARLIDRLGARLGRTRLTRLVPRDVHIPEHAHAAVSAQSALSDGAWHMHAGQAGELPLRPIRLFARPEPVQAMAAVPDGPPLRFRWRRVLHEVARAEGPERIAAQWWHDAEDGSLTRDYFRVEDAAGRRFWLFRDGLFEFETREPRWFVHGLFA
jgi:protein ImuB